MSMDVPAPAKFAIRTLLILTSRPRAAKQLRRTASLYHQLFESLSTSEATSPIRVPEMRGVDDDMRDWSLCETLEHNAIVNRSITAVVVQLAHGEELHGPALINPKTDVIPRTGIGTEAMDHFRQSVEDHLDMLTSLPELRGTKKFNHPVFGPFDAHMWNGMMGLHLKLHLPQAQFIASKARRGTAPAEA